MISTAETAESPEIAPITSGDTNELPDSTGASLRTKVLRGGAFLVIRQAIGLALTLAGVLFVTRVIGPREYGIYAVAMGIVNFCCNVGTWGLDVYLLRKADVPDEMEFDQVFTLLLCISAALFGGLTALGPVIGSFVKIPGVSRLVIFLAAGIPLNLLAIPAIIKLDRALNFKQVAINELAGQAAMYLVAIVLAFSGWGAWAPGSGFLTQQLVLAGLSYRSARYRPSLFWNRALIVGMLRYGLAYSSSIWVWQMRSLVNPFLVGRFGGAEAVGYVALSIRFVEVLAFAKTATWRIAMAALARIHDDRRRLRNSITEGMRLQAMAVGFPLAVFALVGPFLVARGLGHNWTPALTVFPFIALSYLSNAMFNLHSSVLYLLGKNSQVTIFHTLHLVLFAGSAAVLVPSLGLVGYGWAEVAALFSYPLIHIYLTRQVGSPSYGTAAIWYLTEVLVVMLGCCGIPALYYGIAALFLPLCFPKERMSLVVYARVLRLRKKV